MMLNLRGVQFLKIALISVFVVFGLGFNHVALADAPLITGATSNSSKAMRCKSVCSSGLIDEKQDGLQPFERDDKAPKPVAYIAPPVVLALITLLFVVKILPLLSSWRPPDLIALCGHYADGL